MTITGKFSFIIFLVLPAGFFGSIFLLEGYDPWGFIAACVWVVVVLLLLRSLKCPRCHCIVYQTKYWPLSRMDLYDFGVVLRRCGSCGCALDSDEKGE